MLMLKIAEQIYSMCAAVCPCGLQSWIQISISLICSISAPSAPLNLTFPPGGVLINSIALTWLQPQYPNGIVRFYQVQLVFNGVGEPLLVNTTGNTTTAVLSDLTPGTQYNVSVRAFTVALGPFSDQLTLHTADGEDMQY